jgi:hypothetical protein
VQDEVEAGDDWHLDLVRQFADLGYHSYRLVPGQDLWVPFDPDLPVDHWQRSLQELAATILRDSSLDPQEPFLVPCERFEALPPGGAIAEWTLAAVLEELERLAAFSSFYTGPTGLPRLQHLVSLGFDGPEMRRRRELIGRRFGSPQPS